MQDKFLFRSLLLPFCKWPPFVSGRNCDLQTALCCSHCCSCHLLRSHRKTKANQNRYRTCCRNWKKMKDRFNKQKGKRVILSPDRGWKSNGKKSRVISVSCCVIWVSLLYYLSFSMSFALLLLLYREKKTLSTADSLENVFTVKNSR